mgnify:CR=1 FL=1
MLSDCDLVSPALRLISGYTLSVTTTFVSDSTLPFEYHWVTYGIFAPGIGQCVTLYV